MIDTYIHSLLLNSHTPACWVGGLDAGDDAMLNDGDADDDAMLMETKIDTL